MTTTVEITDHPYQGYMAVLKDAARRGADVLSQKMIDLGKDPRYDPVVLVGVDGSTASLAAALRLEWDERDLGPMRMVFVSKQYEHGTDGWHLDLSPSDFIVYFDDHLCSGMALRFAQTLVRKSPVYVTEKDGSTVKRESARDIDLIMFIRGGSDHLFKTAFTVLQ